MNDNHRTPEAHRMAVEALSKSQPQGNPRPYRSAVWPQGERLYSVGRLDLLGGLNDWQRLNDAPVLCVANDNWVEDSDIPREPDNFDNRMESWTAERAIAKHAAGKKWRPPDEVFARPRRSDPAKSNPVGMYKANGVVLYQIGADAEDEADRVIDCKNIRAKLGTVACKLMDEASSDSTTEQIAAIIKCDNIATEKYIDAAISKFIAVAA